MPNEQTVFTTYGMWGNEDRNLEPECRLALVLTNFACVFEMFMPTKYKDPSPHVLPHLLSKDTLKIGGGLAKVSTHIVDEFMN